MRYVYLISSLIIYMITFEVFPQGAFLLPEGKNHIKIKADVVNNLMIIPVQVNGVELSLLLDTGVRSTILFNAEADYPLELNNQSTVWLRGAGDGEPTKAIKSTQNIINVGEAAAINQTIYYVSDSAQNFSPRLGFPVHGIIGYALLKDLAVELNYQKSYVKLYEPEVFRSKKFRSCTELVFELNKGKPYLNIGLSQNDTDFQAKLLLDSGSGDALWLFENTHEDIRVSENSFKDHLGLGLNGEVTGHRSRIAQLTLGDFNLKKVNVAYPDELSLAYLNGVDYRNGSIGAEVLRRFTVYLDYSAKKMFLRKNRYFDEPFRYNRSGLVVEHSGFELVADIDYSISKTSGNATENNATKTIFLETNMVQFPQLQLKPNYEIAAIRDDSPGAEAGLAVGDKLVKINGRDVRNLELDDITKHFFKEEGAVLRLKVERNGMVFNRKLRLKKLIKDQ
ncbi:MAG: signaling protein [Leeuwenhoekiella sp.]|nr:signaling protein [Leeuwenhoekiella sp.]HCW64534.1 signaling protein [Leeuwenhoekiella sp.]